MKRILSLALIVSALSSCMKKVPSVSYYGKVQTAHGYVMKNTDVIFITNMRYPETSRRICKTDSFGLVQFESELVNKKTKLGIECITDSGSFKVYDLDKNAMSALSHTIVLQ